MNVYTRIEKEIFEAYCANKPITKKVYELYDKLILVSIDYKNQFAEGIVVYRIATIDSFECIFKVSESYDMVIIHCNDDITYFTSLFKETKYRFKHRQSDSYYMSTYIDNSSKSILNHSFNICNWYYKGKYDYGINIEFANENDKRLSSDFGDIFSQLGKRHVCMHINIYIQGYVYEFLTLRQLWQIIKNLHHCDAKSVITRLIFLMYKNPLKISDDDKQLLLKYIGEKCEFLFAPIYTNTLTGNYIYFHSIGEVTTQRKQNYMKLQRAEDANIFSLVRRKQPYSELLDIKYNVFNNKHKSYMEVIKKNLIINHDDFAVVQYIQKLPVNEYVQINDYLVGVFEVGKLKGVIYHDKDNEYEPIKLTVSDIHNWFDAEYIQSNIKVMENKIQVLMKLHSKGKQEIINTLKM